MECEDVACCYRCSVVYLSVCLSVCVCLLDTGMSELFKNSWTDWDTVWVVDSGGPKEARIRWGPVSLRGRGNFGRQRDMSHPIVKYTLRREYGEL